MILLATE